VIDLLSGDVYVAFAGQKDPLAPHQVEVVEPLLAFGNQYDGYGSIHGCKFNDRNGDGTRDPGEGPFGGVPFALYVQDPNGDFQLLETATTASTGAFWFMGLRPGVYRLEEMPLAGSTPTTPNVITVEIEPDDEIHFGSCPLPGSIHGFKFEDVDGDGSYDEMSDLPFPEVTFTLAGDVDGDGDQDTIDVQTNQDGEFWFVDLVPGPYTVTETPPDGTFATTPITRQFDVAAGQELVAFSGQAMLLPGQEEVVLGEQLMFGNRRGNSLHVHKWHDRNADGVRQEDEEFLNGWEIRLLDATGTVIAQCTTHEVDEDSDGVRDEHGACWFENLSPGTYLVEEVPQPGWLVSFPAAAPPAHTIDLTSGDDISVEFGNYQPAAIHGLKYHDRNGDGDRDAGDTGLADWTITLTGTDGMGNPVNRTELTMVGDPTTVADDGMYWFTDLKPGTYTLREESRANWRAINPSSGEYTVTVSSGQVLTDFDFGNRFIPPDNPVLISLRVTNATGAAISQVRVGQTIHLEAFAEDTRPMPAGVFAAYLDVLYDAARAVVSGPIVYGASLEDGHSGDTATRGLLDEVGAFSGESASSENPVLVFRVPLRATAAGRLSFFADAADVLPDHDVLLFGQPDAVSRDAIEFGSVTINILAPRWQNPKRALDVNGDLHVSPIDALQIVNELNDPQFSDELGQLLSERPTGVAIPFLDVNGDDFVSAIDALQVINEVNQPSAAAEGESLAYLADPLLPQPDGFQLARSEPIPGSSRATLRGTPRATWPAKVSGFVAPGVLDQLHAANNAGHDWRTPPEPLDEAWEWGELESVLDELAGDVAKASRPG
jgi:protocatechuate 3,4-dioxygenase beta subunit